MVTLTGTILHGSSIHVTMERNSVFAEAHCLSCSATHVAVHQLSVG